MEALIGTALFIAFIAIANIKKVANNQSSSKSVTEETEVITPLTKKKKSKKKSKKKGMRIISVMDNMETAKKLASVNIVYVLDAKKEEDQYGVGYYKTKDAFLYPWDMKNFQLQRLQNNINALQRGFR